MHEELRELGFTQLELRDLLAVTHRHCQCAFDGLIGSVVNECGSHLRLEDATALRRLLFARRLAKRWRSGEFQAPLVSAVDPIRMSEFRT